MIDTLAFVIKLSSLVGFDNIFVHQVVVMTASCVTRFAPFTGVSRQTVEKDTPEHRREMAPLQLTEQNLLPNTLVIEVLDESIEFGSAKEKKGEL